MKEGINNEIELLLRKLGKSGRSKAVETRGDGLEHSKHLDADELNAYAENSLPERARSFYSEHLAECLACRDMVIRLNRASGFQLRELESQEIRQSVLQRLLAVSSSWLKLRYAVPTFVALAILVFAIVVVRRGPRGELLAQREQNLKPTSSVTDGYRQAETSQSRPEYADTNSSNAKEEAKKQVKKSTDSAATNRAGEGPEETRSDAVAENSQRELDKIEKEQQSKLAEEPAPAAKAAAQAPPPKPVIVDQNAAPSVAKSAEVEQTKNGPTTSPKSGAADEDQKSRNAERKKPQVAASETSSARDVGGAAIRRGAVGGLRATNEKAKDDADTRSIAGRRFRREGSKWIDTAYTAGASTVNLTRGSEHYRALIADEPEIGEIADHLDGEVIIVWKGRAYRIR